MSSKHLAAITIALGCLLVPLVARADEPPSSDLPSTPPVESVGPFPEPKIDAAEVRRRLRESYWGSQATRPFVAVTIDVGYLYLRPRLTLGYGKPFSRWVGVDANPIATASYAGGYAGVRAQIPWFDLRVGARWTRSYEHHFLNPRESYETVDLNDATNEHAEYFTGEAELSGAIPAGPGSVLLVLTASSIHGQEGGKFVYEETLRVIADPPAIYRARSGYALRLGAEGNARVGIVGEVLDLPGRGEAVFRAGVIGSFAIDEHLEAVGLLVIPIASPDAIGIYGGDYGELGLRYRWAAGEPGPHF